MKSANRVLAIMLAVLMILSTMPAFARTAAVSDFSDFPWGSWSEEAMTEAVENHLLEGKGNGTIAPKDYLTRAEAAAVINRAFGATVKADISAFTDVEAGAWYYDEIAKAVNMQTIVGVSATKADPTGYITRESMLSVLARALVLDDGNVSVLSNFADGNTVSAWAKGSVSAMAERGYVKGNEKGQLNPQSYITREEFAQVMHNIFKVYIPDDVTINGGSYGTTVIRAKDVTLNHVTIYGDLVAGDGVGAGNLNLTNVTVKGRILFRGGEGNVKLTNTTVGEKVVVNDVNGVVNFLNYRVEAPFVGIQENTKATFLNMAVNTGGSSSTPSREEYKIREYLQNIDGTYPGTATNSDEKKADYGKTVNYEERSIKGFTFDSSHPDSVLSGSNRGKLVLKAYYARNKYKVSFDGYEVMLPYEQKISADETLKNKMQQTVEENENNGYSTKFNTKADGTGDEVTLADTKVGTEDLPIYAIKTPIEYKINYNLNGGSIEGNYEKTFNVEDEDYTLPVPVKDGYIFAGWTDENGAPIAVIAGGSKGDKTVNANWTVETYAITYVPGEYGTMEGVENVKYTYTIEDDKYTLPDPVVTKPDYVFKGWYTNAEFTGKAVTVIAKGSTGDKTFYARIEERTYEQYTITFNGVEYAVTEGEKISEAEDARGNKLGDAMDAVTVPDGYEKDDFRVKGDDDTRITKDTIATEDMEIEAAKKIIVYTIEYITNGGSFAVEPVGEYTVETETFNLPVPSKDNHRFLGWYENSGFSGEAVGKIEKGTTGNKKYYANWLYVEPAPDVFTITFNGTGYEVTENNALNTNAELKAAMEDAADKTGYTVTFNTKADGTGTDITTAYVPTGDMTIYAVEEAIVYSIKYELRGGALDGSQKTTYTVEDADYTLPVPTRDDHEFLGWYEDEDFSGKAVTVLVTADAENKTYYASWLYVAPALDVYTITFNGTGYEVTENNALNTKAELKAAMEAAADKTGYTVTFNTKADGTGTDITTAYVPTGDMTIYAIEEAIVYSITYELHGGALDGSQKTTYTVEDADYTLPVPTKDSYVFKGWYEKEDFSGKAVTALDTADAESKTYYAKWVLDNAVLSFDHEINGDTITLKVMLNAIPADIDDIAAISLRYAYDNSKLKYEGSASNVGEVISATAGYISWYSNENYITADTLAASDNVLFTITFSKASGAYGTTEISYTLAEITASEPKANPAIATKYDTEDKETIDLGTQVQTYTITYITNGGNDIPNGSYTTNDADITLPVPTRSGYAFKGWYEEEDFSGKAVTVLDTADAEDKTYYAKWVTENATLDFSAEIDGDTIKIYVTLDEVPSDIDDIAAFTLKYRHPENKLSFVGGSTEFGGNFSATDGYISWYTNDTATAITSESLKANRNILATLVFTKAPSASGVETFEYTFVEIVASKPENNPAIASKYTTGIEEVQLDATQYVVTFNGATYNITAGKALSANAALVAAMEAAADKTGYNVTFNTKADGTGTDITTAYVPAGNMTIYIVEEAIEYSITYDLGGIGSLPSGAKKSYTVADAFELPVLDDTADYTFEGWKDAQGNLVTEVVAGTTGNLTFTAVWEEIIIPEAEYKITYELNGIGELPVDAWKSYKTSQLPYKLPVLDDTADYTFEGWKDAQGNLVTEVVAGTTGNLTFTAVWEEIIIPEAEYKITYELNGIGELPVDAWESYKTSQLAYTLPVPNDTATHVFVAWYDNKELTGTPVTEIAEGTTGDKTYYAKWEEIPEDAYVITYVTNGGALDGTQRVTYTASVLPYTLPIPTKDGAPFLGWYEYEDFSGDPVTEIVAGSTGDKTYYAKWATYDVQFYLGTALSRNKPYSLDGDRGLVNVEHGVALTQADVDRELGMMPSEYNMAEGYTDSDGVIHEIAPELWYQNNGEWVKFIPEDVPVVSDMNVYLFTRYVSLAYSTDLQIKGVDMSEIGDIAVTVPYDSNTDIGKTFLDALTNAGETMDRILDQIEMQGYDLYQMAIDKAASKGLVDTDGNILNPNVPIPLHKLITEDMIMDEINRYIDDNIDNEDFIADILRNDIVVDMLLNDEELKHSAMGNPEIREIFLTDEFIKEIIRLHPEFVDIMIDHEEFIELIINNDATFDYVLSDDTMVSKILDNDAFKSKVIEKGTNYIVDSYFGEGGDREIKDYITKQLKSENVKAQLKDMIQKDENVKERLKETLKTDAEANEIIKQEIRKMLNDEATKDDIRNKIKEYLLANPDMVKDDVKEFIKSKKDDADFKAKVKSYIEGMKDDADFKAKVKSYIEGMKDDADFEAKVKSYIEGMKDDADFKAKVKSYIEGMKDDADFKAKVKSYIEGKQNDADFKAKVESYIEGKENESEFKDKVEIYIEGKQNDADFKEKVETYIKGKENEPDFKAKVETYIEGKRDDAGFKAKIKTYAKDKAKTDKNAVLSNATVKNAFLTEAQNVIDAKGLTGTVTADEILAKYLDGSLSVDYSEIFTEIDSAYEEAFASNYDTYFEENYNNLFNTYFKNYFDENYSTLFTEYFGEYFESNYTDLFDEYFKEYFDANYTNLFDEYFEEYFDANYTNLFDEYFEEYFDANYTNLFGEYFEEYFDANYTGLFGDYFGEYFDTNYESLFKDYFEEYFIKNYDNLFSDYFEEYFTKNYDNLFSDYFEEYFTKNYEGLFEDYFEEYFEENYTALFNEHFSEYFDELSDSEFDNLVNEHFDKFYTTQFDTLFEEYFDDYFNTVFDSLYESNVEKWAEIAYKEPTTQATVVDTIEDVISDLVDSYIAGTADTELKDFIDKIVEEFGVKEYVRDNYHTDAELKATIDKLVKDNAKSIIDDYANNKASEAIVELIDENMHKYIEEIVDDYVNYELDEDLAAFIDEEINVYMLQYINKYIDGTDRVLLSKLVPTYAHDAVEAIKETDAFKNTISDFVSGEGVRVNEDNLMFIEILDELMHTYNYDKLASDFLPENIQKIVDFIGHDMVAHIVDDYFAAFCLEMDEAIAKLNADIDAGIEGTEYKFSTSPAVRINYMEIVKGYYDKLVGKMREKINSQSKIPVSSNPYAQRLVDMDYFALFFDEGAPADEYKSGYKLKDDIMEYYYNALEVVVLVHDAVTYYGKMDEYTLEEKIDAVSHVIGTYANKANNVIMNYINTGELPKGYTPQELADLILDKVLGLNGAVDNAYNKIEDYYMANEDKILEYIEKAKTFYEEYLDRDYTDIVDLANMSIYSGGDSYKIYQIILENGEDAFDFDDAVTAIFDSPNYRGISKIEDAMAKVESKIKGLAYTPENDVYIYYVDAYKATLENREIKGYGTGTHTIALQRYLRYYK